MKKTFPIIGMHCASCKALIEDVVSDLAGVTSVGVNYATEKMTIEYDPQKVDISALKKSVASAGSYELVDNSYEETVKQESHEMTLDGDMRVKRYVMLKNTIFWLGIGSIPFAFIMIWMTTGMFLGLMMPEEVFGSLFFFHLMQFLIATPILFIGGKEIFQ
ncbi:hypothetical protein COV58_03565, partial [Candidatus Roizmanbacteria bacterium CG11_big_fil_rev_8_21_14_0_20_36_8]